MALGRSSGSASCQGLGLGFVFVPLSTVAFATLGPQLRTDGTAIFSLLRNIGAAIGISVVTALLIREHPDRCTPAIAQRVRRGQPRRLVEAPASRSSGFP
jgi:hypothetical protein